MRKQQAARAFFLTWSLVVSGGAAERAIAAPIIDNPGFEIVYQTGTNNPVNLSSGSGGYTNALGTNVAKSTSGNVDTPGLTASTSTNFDSGIISYNSTAASVNSTGRTGNYLYGNSATANRFMSISGDNTLQANTTYVLTAEVAQRFDAPHNTPASGLFVGLQAAGVDLTPTASVSPALNSTGDFFTYSRTYTTGASDPNLAGLLRIRLAGSNLGVDNLTLSATPVPEPTGAGMLGTAALGLLWRRRRAAVA